MHEPVRKKQEPKNPTSAPVDHGAFGKEASVTEPSAAQESLKSNSLPTVPLGPQTGNAGPTCSSSEVFTGTSFFRYLKQSAALERHMVQHIAHHLGDYSVLCVGASEGKEAITALACWRSALEYVNPNYQGRILIVCVEPNPDAVAVFKQNRFPVFPSKDQCLDKIECFASAIQPAEPPTEGPAFVRPQKYYSFPPDFLKPIHYEQSTIEQLDLRHLAEKHGITEFQAVIYHTVERYLSEPEVVREKLSKALCRNGYFSYVP